MIRHYIASLLLTTYVVGSVKFRDRNHFEVDDKFNSPNYDDKRWYRKFDMLDSDDTYNYEVLSMERQRRAFGHNDYVLPENFKTPRGSDIPVTYRLHDDLLRYYR
ncbi:hypothetical protein DICVIV_01612 [Dictyocaulus viviparus]|uniref:Uncharacterized protein n=1 Tax=Dictyocaulus viviparus TaxID=29172 RepID=A0A0D8Y7G7_DICVI|nr:hypothetical protein DICVIV_01612 [Dictyocaulus viviparus]